MTVMPISASEKKKSLSRMPSFTDAGQRSKTPQILRVAREAVACAAHGLNQRMVTPGLECLAQPPDMDVHGALLDEHVVPPDVVQKLGARVHTVGMRHEEMQQPELGRPQDERVAPGAHPVADRVEPEAFDFDRVVRDLR